jgi:hypothetical protein
MEGKMTKFQMIAADLDLDYGFDELQCQQADQDEMQRMMEAA